MTARVNWVFFTYSQRKLDTDVRFLGDNWIFWVWLHKAFVLEKSHLDGEVSKIGLVVNSCDGGGKSIGVDGVLVFISALELNNVESHLDSFFGWKSLSFLAVDDGVGVFVVATFVLGYGAALGEWGVDS